ncbi:DUF2752 domain-containing protein [Luteococcus sp. Sow4_B9]|uniref:DUF2752 domain-containing protein n=1 Tax=Luteococcus sp. Sow4_B9 TaxID=3438792 RepID=UPI003F99FC0C
METPGQPFEPARALRGVLGLLAVGGVQLASVAVFGRGLPCPLREFTGLLCPVCGVTTAAIHLMHGDWVAAWCANPFMMVVGVVLGACTVAWLVALAGGPALRPPACWGRFTMDRVLLLLLGPALVFMVMRNVV